MGFPVANDFRLFEKIYLEGFQSGLSWITILRKRENFRKAFAGFGFYKIAVFVDEFGSLASYIWKWELESPEPGIGKNDNNSAIPSIKRHHNYLVRI